MKVEGIVSFEARESIPESLLHRLVENAQDYGLNGIVLISAREIIVAPWVHLKCRYGCNHYDTNWCCPPATPEPEKVQTILDDYSVALLLIGNRNSPSFYKNGNRKRVDHVRHWKATISIERLLFLEGYYKAFSLMGETCALCKECTYPKACRFPKEKRPSLEALSIDILGTLKKLGKKPKIAQHPSESFSYYSIVLVE